MATATDTVLTVIAWIGARLDRGNLRGVIRSAIQAGWISILTLEVTQSWLRFLTIDVGPPAVSAAQATVYTMAALWWIGDRVQKSSWVQSHPIPRAIMAVVMGGTVAPAYSVSDAQALATMRRSG